MKFHVGNSAAPYRSNLPRPGMAAFALLLLVCGLLFPGRLHAADNTPSAVDRRIRSAEALGVSLYRQDTAAARATDILFSQQPDLERHPVLGWVVTGEDSAPLVTFIGQKGEEYVGQFDVRPGAEEGKRFVLAGGRKLTAEERARFMARQATLPLIPEFCAENCNSLVLRNPDGTGWLAYWFAASSEPNLILLGGHTRFTVSADGGTVLSRDERFSLSRCLTLDKRQKPDNVVGLTVTFSGGDEPVETHVFLSLYYKMPLYVRTQSGGLWKVENGTVSAASLP